MTFLRRRPRIAPDDLAAASARRGSGAGVRVAAGVAVGALALSACTGDDSDGPKATGRTSDPSATAAPTVSLDRFYSQKLSWSECEGGAQCADLQVPVDYAKPNGQTIKIKVLKRGATGKKIGSLVVNPGGPGGSGVDYANAADLIVGEPVRRAYDIVGFDPRGVQRSAPVTCLSNAAMDKNLGGDPTPDDAAEQKAFMSGSKSFGAACQAKAGNLIGHVSTVEAAKDMDVLRSALGEGKLDYLGKSYGTFLGTTYADLFPSKVGRFVLDGVVPPDLSTSQVNKGQAEGFERATRAYVKDCVEQGTCPLGSDEEAGMKKLRDFLKQVDSKPLPVANDTRVKQLTEGWASMGIAQAMYAKQLWPDLTKALQQAFAGNGDGLMELANSYASRDSEGNYSGNIMQVISAVNCLDRGGSADPKVYAKDAAEFAKVAPTWGPMLAWGSATCGTWPIKATGQAKKITAKGAGPILVVGTTRDPATPYEWSVRLNDMLSDSRLISYDGDGHTAYASAGSSCVDDLVNTYLLRGTVPQAKDTKCS